MDNFEFNIGNKTTAQIKILRSVISFNAELIKMLNFPKFICMGLDKKDKKLGIRAAEKEDKLVRVYPFVTDEKKKKHIILSATKIRDEILKFLGVSLEGNGIKFYADWDNKNNMAIVNLDKYDQ